MYYFAIRSQRHISVNINTTFSMKRLYLEVSIGVETLGPPLLQPVSDLYGDSHIFRAVCQEHVKLPFPQILCHSMHSGYMIMNNIISNIIKSFFSTSSSSSPIPHHHNHHHHHHDHDHHIYNRQGIFFTRAISSLLPTQMHLVRYCLFMH